MDFSNTEKVIQYLAEANGTYGYIRSLENVLNVVSRTVTSFKIENSKALEVLKQTKNLAGCSILLYNELLTPKLDVDNPQVTELRPPPELAHLVNSSANSMEKNPLHRKTSDIMRINGAKKPNLVANSRLPVRRGIPPPRLRAPNACPKPAANVPVMARRDSIMPPAAHRNAAPNRTGPNLRRPPPKVRPDYPKPWRNRISLIPKSIKGAEPIKAGPTLINSNKAGREPVLGARNSFSHHEANSAQHHSSLIRKPHFSTAPQNRQPNILPPKSHQPLLNCASNRRSLGRPIIRKSGNNPVQRMLQPLRKAHCTSPTLSKPIETTPASRKVSMRLPLTANTQPMRSTTALSAPYRPKRLSSYRPLMPLQLAQDHRQPDTSLPVQARLSVSIDGYRPTGLPSTGATRTLLSVPPSQTLESIAKVRRESEVRAPQNLHRESLKPSEDNRRVSTTRVSRLSIPNPTQRIKDLKETCIKSTPPTAPPNVPQTAPSSALSNAVPNAVPNAASNAAHNDSLSTADASDSWRLPPPPELALPKPVSQPDKPVLPSNLATNTVSAHNQAPPPKNLAVPHSTPQTSFKRRRVTITHPPKRDSMAKPRDSLVSRKSIHHNLNDQI